jgi:hypothetical protein
MDVESETPLIPTRPAFLHRKRAASSTDDAQTMSDPKRERALVCSPSFSPFQYLYSVHQDVRAPSARTPFTTHAPAPPARRAHVPGLLTPMDDEVYSNETVVKNLDHIMEKYADFEDKLQDLIAEMNHLRSGVRRWKTLLEESMEREEK